jgi:conjugative transfer signal peptidase TraF
VSARFPRPRNTPLLDWGDALRADKLRHKRILRRSGFVACISTIVLIQAAVAPLPRLVWNASTSAPPGLYLVSPGAMPGLGDMVVARLPVTVRSLASERRYLPANVPLVKRVAAVAGDDVCASGPAVAINGRVVAKRRWFDGMGRHMPFWLGCTRLRGRELLLLTDDPASFDGRYFGVTEETEVIGKAQLLWPR